MIDITADDDSVSLGDRVTSGHYRYIDSLVLFAFALVVIATLAHLRFTALRSLDPMEYAVIARELRRGNGFATKIVYTLSLAFSERYVGHPSLHRPPVYPVLVAASQAVFGSDGSASIAVNVVAFSSLPPLLYLLGRELYDRRTAAIAGVVLVFSVAPIRFALSGMSESVYLVLFLAIVLLALRDRPLGAGALIGVAYLTRYNTLFLAPGLLLLVFLVGDGDSRTRARRVAATAGIATLVAAPWFLRNLLVVGDPFFSIQRYEVVMFTQSYPERSLYHSLTPVSPVGFVLNNPGEMVVKFVSGARSLYIGIPKLFPNWVIVPLVAVGLYESRSREIRRLTVGLAVMFVVQFLVLSVVTSLSRLFTPFIPFLLLFASKGIVEVANRVSLPQVSVDVVTVAVVALVLVPNLFVVGVVTAELEASNRVTEEKDALADVRAETPDDAVIVSDAPWSVGWHSDRATVLTPEDPSVLDGRLSDVDYIYVSTKDGDKMGSGMYKDRLLESRVVETEFEVAEEYDSGAMLLERSGDRQDGTDAG